MHGSLLRKAGSVAQFRDGAYRNACLGSFRWPRAADAGESGNETPGALRLADWLVLPSGAPELALGPIRPTGVEPELRAYRPVERWSRPLDEREPARAADALALPGDDFSPDGWHADEPEERARFDRVPSRAAHVFVSPGGALEVEFP
jgi:hypothetical protein